MKKIIFLITAIIFLISPCEVMANAVAPPCVDNPSVYTLYEYKLFVKEQFLLVEKANLVTYDMIEDAGAFSAFRIIETNEQPKNNIYCYQLDDQIKQSYTFYIETKPSDALERFQEQANTEITLDDVSDNLTTCEIDGYTHMAIGNVHYYYESKVLLRIAWEIESHVIFLAFPQFSNISVASYDLKEGTFLYQMLNADTAEQAVAEISETIERKLAWKRLVYIGCPLLIIIGIFLLGYTIIHKIVLLRKEKEKAMLLESDSLRNDPPTDSNEPTPPEAATDNVI